MTVRHMTIFLAVFETQNITRAAGRLHMTQPAVTRAIKEIESYYRVCLFERYKRRLMVTETARQLYAQALHIVDAFDHMEKGLRNWDRHGVLRVGASITLGNFALPELAKRFKQRYPSLRLQVLVSNGASLQQALLENQLDLALVEGGGISQELHTEPLCEDRLVLILPLNHPLVGQRAISLTDVAAQELLLREKGSAGRTFLDSIFAMHGIVVHPVWESTSTQALVKAVACGLGVSILPMRLVQSALEEGIVVAKKIADEPLCRKNYLVWHQNKYLTTSARDFIALCRIYFTSASELTVQSR